MSNKLVGTVSGYVVADAEVSEKFVKFRMAINRGVKNKETGQWEETPMWLRCVDFLVARSSKLAKGALVSVTGEINWDERPEGGFYAPELKVMNVDILLWANNEEGKSGNREAPKAKRKGADLPF